MPLICINLHTGMAAKVITSNGGQGPGKQEVMAMFMDEVVFAGLLIVGLTCAFFAGVYIAIRKDISKHGTGE